MSIPEIILALAAVVAICVAVATILSLASANYDLRAADRRGDRWEHAYDESEEARYDLAAALDTERTEHASAPIAEAAPPPTPISDEERTKILALRCNHCGMIHTVACPRVKRFRFRPDGTSLLEVEFFEDWPRADVVSVDDYIEQRASTLTTLVSIG